MSNVAEKITDSELEVMQTLWEAPDALPITEIRQTLQQRKGWESTTIKTLVQRLCKKGAVGQEKRTVFYYRALISRQEYNDWATDDLVHKLYQGSAKSLVAALVQTKGLTQDDLDELRGMFKVEE
jgi:BlaI family penicillinase repressor